MNCLASAATSGQTAKLVGNVPCPAVSLEAFVNGLLQHDSEVVDDEQGLVQVVKQLLSTGTESDQVHRYDSARWCMCSLASWRAFSVVYPPVQINNAGLLTCSLAEYACMPASVQDIACSRSGQKCTDFRHAAADLPLCCRLSEEDSTAVLAYFLHILPQLHTSSSTPAAMVLLDCSSVSNASASLQSAVTLLQHLPLGLAPAHGHSHPHPHNHPTGATTSLTAGQAQLVCKLLQLFSVKAFDKLLAHKPRTKAAKVAMPVVSDGAEQLVLLTRFGSDRPQDSLAASIRQAAFQQLTADVYACLPVQQQMKAFLVRSAPFPLCACSRSCFQSAEPLNFEQISALQLTELL